MQLYLQLPHKLRLKREGKSGDNNNTATQAKIEKKIKKLKTRTKQLQLCTRCKAEKEFKKKL